jgi:arylsulfatase A-like enzyme
MGRSILFITTDQQRYDALGCNGGTIARTPVIDALAAEGLNYSRAYNQNTVCMPARSTMLTGQHVRSHGVVANGIPLPTDAPSVAAHLRDRAGYRTALLGKAHFEPGWDPHHRWEENRRPRDGDIGEWRGFETAINVMHTALYPDGRPALHYGYWVEEHHPEHLRSFAKLLSAKGGGDTGAPETKNNPIEREWYHTDWVADHTIAWLDALAPDDDFFCWMSFPDPHHPWDPPASELHRVPWQELDLPERYIGDHATARRVLGAKPAHWLAFWEGSWSNFEGGPGSFNPRLLTADMLREVNAKTHVMNELLDEAIGRVVERLRQLGRWDDTDVVFTTDHGELQGDFGLLFKGPFHCEALMHLPFLWRPAPSAGLPTGVTVSDHVGQVDLARTFCNIAGVEPTGCRATCCRPPTARPGGSGSSPSGTASSRRWACTCAPSTVTGGPARCTSRRPGGSPTGWRRSTWCSRCSAGCGPSGSSTRAPRASSTT